MISVAESIVTGIQSLIKTNIPSVLSDVRTDRGDAKVTTEPPVNYFIYDGAIGYKTPAVFILADNVDFRLGNGPNAINSLVTVYVSCVLEDRTKELLTLKCYRYHDALHKVLNRAHIVDDTKKRQAIIKVTRSDFSSIQQKSATDSIFRKEVMLTLEVEHYENEN